MCYANQGRRKTQSLAYQHFPTSKIHDFNVKNLVPLKMQKMNSLAFSHKKVLAALPAKAHLFSLNQI